MALFALFVLACLASPLLHSTTATATATTTRSTAASGLVDYVCNLTTHDFCHDLLDPYNSMADPYELAVVAFSFTYYNATDTMDYIQSWLRSKNNPKPGMREGMMDCEGNYKQAIRVLQKVSDDLGKGIYKKLTKLATKAEECGLACETAFKGGYPDGIIARKNQNFIDLADICVVISYLLA